MNRGDEKYIQNFCQKTSKKKKKDHFAEIKVRTPQNWRIEFNDKLL
jgi:hypothetical protein